MDEKNIEVWFVNSNLTIKGEKEKEEEEKKDYYLREHHFGSFVGRELSIGSFLATLEN